MRALFVCLSVILAAAAVSGARRAPTLRGEWIFPPGSLHSHASCVVECANGDLLAVWYRGSGERSADDVEILGARLAREQSRWSGPFPVADEPGFPDCNPCMLIDPHQRLWLFWPMLQANEWHTALLKAKSSTDYQRRGRPPVWGCERVIHLKPGEEFTRTVQRSVEEDLRHMDRFPEEQRPRVREYLERRRTHAADHYFNRVGWMPRAHPFLYQGRRLIVPLYSDGFDFSLMAISDDWGKSWTASAPLPGDGPVQPSIAVKRDGALAAYMRDNGPPPKRLLYSESRDGGLTWAPVRDTEIPNPGSGAEVVTLRDGRWALVYNDTERGRHSLAVSLSDDDGKTWKWTRHLERDAPGPDAGSYSYPSLIQAGDGTLHATYSFTVRPSRAAKDAAGRSLRETIKHAHFPVEWVEQGD